MLSTLRKLVIAVPCIAFASVSYATIISGAVSVKLSVPFADSSPYNTVGNDTFQNTNLYGFDEGQNINITTDLNVDDVANGLGGGSGAGVLSAGTVVASHYIFFDPAASASQIGFVNFDSDILGILSSTTNLSNSDFLINTGVTYLNPAMRGLEAGDSVTITGLRQITVDWTASTPGDYVRVLTAYSPGAVNLPEPGALALMGIGLVGFGFTRKIHKS